MYTQLDIVPVKEYNRSASTIMKFYHERNCCYQERNRGYVIVWKNERGGSGARFFIDKTAAEMKKESMLKETVAKV